MVTHDTTLSSRYIWQQVILHGDCRTQNEKGFRKHSTCSNIAALKTGFADLEDSHHHWLGGPLTKAVIQYSGSTLLISD